MPAKQRNSNNERFMPKKQRSESPRKKRGRKIVIPVILAVIIAAISTGGWFYYDSQVKPYRQAAIKVNEATFDMRYYIDMLELLYGNVSPLTLSSYSSYGEQEVEQLAEYAEQEIIQNEIIKQASAAFGVQVERSTIEATLEEAGIPVTDARVGLSIAQELLEKQVPSTQPQAHVQAMLLESESAAQEAIARLQAGESFEEVADELCKLPSLMIIAGDMGWVTALEADLTVDSTKFGEMVFGADTGVLSGPVYDDTVTKSFGYWVMKVISRIEATDVISAMVHVQRILTGSEPEAYEVIDRLNAGADIEEVAGEFSELEDDENSGIERVWITESDEAEFQAVYDLPVNGISAPIADKLTETKGGYWVFNVLEKEDNRELDTEQYSLLVGEFLKKCVAELEKDPEYNVESFLTEEMVVLAINEAVLAQGKGSVLIRTNSLPSGEAGVSYSFQLEAYGNQKGNTWSITEGKLPDALSLDESGVISGTPDLGGGYSLTIEVNSGLHYWTQDYFLRMYLPISVATTSLSEAQAGEYYSALLEAEGDSSVRTWSIIDGSLPDGLEIRATTGLIHGTPTTAGTYDFTVQVDDGLGKATQALSISVLPAAD